MDPKQFEQALNFIIASVLPVMNCAGPASTVSVQYVGGEILLVPPQDLRRCVLTARSLLGEVFGTVIDGVQSNLVASERRILALDALFGGRVGTSADGRGTQRTLRGNPEAYRNAVSRSREVLERRRNRNPGAIFVVDKQGLGNLLYEIETASNRGYQLVLRPVFRGGRDVEQATIEELADVFGRGFDAWAMKSAVRVEPFVHLLKRRLSVTAAGGAWSVCPFQRNCAEVSLDLEPDGTLYTCLDMADSGQYPFGNALGGTFDADRWRELQARKTRVDPRCAACPWFSACQGGCMSEAIHHVGSPYGRSDLCAVWTTLFRRIDRVIADHGSQEVTKWVRSLQG